MEKLKVDKPELTVSEEGDKIRVKVRAALTEDDDGMEFGVEGAQFWVALKLANLKVDKALAEHGKLAATLEVDLDSLELEVIASGKSENHATTVKIADSDFLVAAKDQRIRKLTRNGEKMYEIKQELLEAIRIINTRQQDDFERAFATLKKYSDLSLTRDLFSRFTRNGHAEIVPRFRYYKDEPWAQELFTKAFCCVGEKYTLRSVITEIVSEPWFSDFIIEITKKGYTSAVFEHIEHFVHLDVARVVAFMCASSAPYDVVDAKWDIKGIEWGEEVLAIAWRNRKVEIEELKRKRERDGNAAHEKWKRENGY